METRYNKNIDIILTEDIQVNLLTKTIAVIGCGGQGGYILEYLVRLGVSSIVFWDGDTYSESNLNRQIGCTEKTIGLNKAKVMFNRLNEINSKINLCYRDWYFGEKNEDMIDLFNCDMIIMAADDSYSVGQTRDMVRLAINQGIPCIDEWVGGFGGNVGIVTNKDLSLWDENTEIWMSQQMLPIEEKNKLGSQTAFRCALIAAETVNQMVQYFMGSPCAALNSNLEIDIYHHKYNRYDRFGMM